MNENEKIYSIIENIKKDVIRTRNKIIYNANEELLKLYFRIGKIINENSNYGNKFISKLSKELEKEYPNSSGFSTRNLSRMKKFYKEYKDFSILPPPVAKLPWTHNCILIDKIDSIEKRIWYAEECMENSWSKVILAHKIELNEYERSNNEKNTNFKKIIKLKENSKLANEIIKDPYIFEIEGLKEKFNERDLENEMVKRIKDVLLELGKGFCFVSNQYKISTKSQDYYIDLLFYHLDLHCYIVVELKTTEFKPDYIGQLGFYVSAIDKTLKKEEDNQTIGLLLCKEKDKITVEWALDFINIPIGVASYNIIKKNQKEILEKLPTEQDIKENLKKKEENRYE